MIAWDQGDPRRIQHALKVYQFASLIGRMEGLPGDVQDVLEIAAILHDIGIHAAEKKYGSTAGKYQEQEGGPLAEQILHELGIPAWTAWTIRFCWMRIFWSTPMRISFRQRLCDLFGITCSGRRAAGSCCSRFTGLHDKKRGCIST